MKMPPRRLPPFSGEPTSRPFWARRRLRGFRLTAIDVDWSAGQGAEVRGPIDSLLLLLTGRATAALPRLAGDGAARLTRAQQPGPT